jgi:hypothetical protein
MTAATTENASELARARFAPRVSSARALVGCAFLLLMLCADVAIAQENKLALPQQAQTLDSMQTNGGTLTIVRIGEESDLKMELRLDGKKIHAIEESMYANFFAQFRTGSMGDVIVMSVNEGGTACPAQFQIIRIEETGKFSITDEFGDCGDSPTITLQLLPDEQVTLRFQGYYRLSEAEEPGFKPPPPTTWVYKRGVLSELKAAPPKRRGK